MNPNFGTRRVLGRKGVGLGVKRLSSGFWNATGKVYTEIVPNAAKKPLQAATRGRVVLDRIIHSDGGRSYDGLWRIESTKSYLDPPAILSQSLESVGTGRKVLIPPAGL